MIAGQPVAYPFPLLADEIAVNDTVGERDIVVFYTSGQASALDEGNIDASRDVGLAAMFRRELDGETLTFFVDLDGVIRDEQTGSAWNVFGTATDGDLAGGQLTPQLAAPHFWFAWAAFQPETLLFGVE